MWKMRRKYIILVKTKRVKGKEMKKKVGVLLWIVLVGIVSACGEKQRTVISSVVTKEETIEVSENLYFTVKGDRVVLESDTKNEQKINVYLEELYENVDQIQKDDAKEYGIWFEKYFSEEERTDHSFFEVSTHIFYTNGEYIVFVTEYYSYWYPSVHEKRWQDYYVFDLKTGDRMVVTDLIDNSEEEIYGMVIAHLKEMFGDEWYIEPEMDTVTEQDRFFLTEEGIGIHYDVYEVSDYPTGEVDILIPYNEVEMK